MATIRRVHLANVAAVVAAGFAAPVALAQEAELGLEEVVRSAMTTYPGLAATRRDVDIAAADALTAAGGFDPRVQAKAIGIPFGPYRYGYVETSVEQATPVWGTRLFGGWRRSQGELAVYDGDLLTNDYGEARAGALVPLLRNGPIDARRAAIRRAELGISLAGATVAERKIAVMRLASNSYWDWVAAGRFAAIDEALLGVGVARDAQLGASVAAGNLPRIERIDNQRAIQQRIAQLEASRRALENAAIELSLFLRNEDGSPRLVDPRRVPSSIPDPEIPETARGTTDVRLALARRPEPRRLEAVAAQAQVDRELAANQKKLGLDVAVAGAKDFGPGDPRIARPELQLMLLVDVPILNRVQTGRERAAEASAAKASLQATLARDRVVADVRDARSAIARARQRVIAARGEVAFAKQLVDLEQQRFALGDGTQFLVNLREQAAAEAEKRLVAALADFQRALVDHRAATGVGGAGTVAPDVARPR